MSLWLRSSVALPVRHSRKWRPTALPQRVFVFVCERKRVARGGEDGRAARAAPWAHTPRAARVCLLCVSGRGKVGTELRGIVRRPAFPRSTCAHVAADDRL